MTKFKVGDKVREVHEDYGVWHGRLTIIVEISARHIKTADGEKYRLNGSLWGARAYPTAHLMHEADAQPFVEAVKIANLRRAVSELALRCSDALALERARTELERGINPEAAE